MALEIDAFYETAVQLTNKAGEYVRNKSGCVESETKSCDIDLVTECDQAVEKMLMEGISTQFPTHKFIGEETVSNGGQCELTDDPTWIIDPIDGTMNFVHAFPHNCISVALFINKEPHIGIVYNPMLNQLFTARKGEGAYLNGKRIHTSNQTDMSKALIMMEGGTSRDPIRTKAILANFEILITKVHGTRCLGSAALDMAMVALGCADAYFEFGPHIWDFAAGALLVLEAGGVVIDPSGGKRDFLSRRILCASTPELAEQIAANLVQYYPTPTD